MEIYSNRDSSSRSLRVALVEGGEGGAVSPPAVMTALHRLAKKKEEKLQNFQF